MSAKARALLLAVMVLMAGLPVVFAGGPGSKADSLLQAGQSLLKYRPEDGIAPLREARLLFKKNNDPERETDCLLALSEIHIRLSDYDVAASLLTDALSTAREAGLPDARIMALISLGRLNTYIGELEQARTFFQDAGLHARNQNKGNLALLSRAYVAYNNFFYLRILADSNLTIIENLYNQVSRPPADTLILMSASNLLGGAYARIRQDPVKAAYYLRQSIDLAITTGDFYRMALVSNNLAEMWINFGEIEKARSMLDQTLATGRQIQARLIIYNAFRMLSLCAERQGRYREALDYYRSYHEMKEKVISQTQIRKAEANFSLYQSEKKARENERIRNEERVLELAAQARLNKYEIFSGAVAGLTLIMGVFLFFNRRKLSEIRKKNQTIENQNEELQRLNEDLREKKQEAEASNQQAQEAIQSKIDFLSVITHEIRTPINAVMGTVQLLEEENPLPQQTKSLEILRFSAENLLSLVNDILDFNKIEAGKIELDAKPFSLKNLVTNIRNSLQLKAADKGIELRLRIDRYLPEAFIGDPLRIGQIFYNLISNAIKFTPEGYVEIEIRYYPERENHRLLALIRDTGIGIEPENREKIFDFFSQGGPGITRRYGGSGLGLTITSRLLALLHSYIELESRPGEGSTFSFFLDLPETRASFLENETGQTGGEEAALPPGRVLFVEDVDYNRIIAERFFRKWHLQFDTARDSASAIRLAEENPYDLILMDLQLPDGNGFDTVREIRRHPRNKNTPVLAMTASGYYEIRDRLAEAGLDGYLSKPFVAQDLKRTLHEWLSRSEGT